MLTCREITEVLTAYLEKRMTLMERAQVRLHLSMCKHCRAYVEQMRITLELTGSLPAEPMPEDVRDELAKRLAGLVRRTPPAHS